MAGPKRQHFIPKSYLRNFAVSPDNEDKAFVEVMNVKTGEIIFPFSISNVCVSKNIYTIPNAKEGDKYALENYYAPSGLRVSLRPNKKRKRLPSFSYGEERDLSNFFVEDLESFLTIDF